MAHDTVPIKIDKQNLTTQTPTTGAALYALGSVGPEFDLFLDNPGPKQDDPIPNDATPITVKSGSHFFTAKKKLNPGNA